LLDAISPTVGDTPIETADNNSNGIYDQGDTITLNFSEPIDFTQFTDISDFGLSGGTWGDTTLDHVSKEDQTDYTSFLTITLQDNSAIDGGATVTLTSDIIIDRSDNVAESNLVYTLPELEQPDNSGPALSLDASYSTDNTITITYNSTGFEDYHTLITQIHVDNPDNTYVGMISENDWSTAEGEITIVMSESNPLRNAGSYKIRVKAPDYDENVTSQVTIVAGSADNIGFADGSTPANPAENGGLLDSIIVEVYDAYNNLCSGISTGEITVAKDTGYVNDSLWNMSGVTQATIASGQAEFTGIYVESVDSQSVHLEFSYSTFDTITGGIVIPQPAAAPTLSGGLVFSDTAGDQIGVIVELGEPTNPQNGFRYLNTAQPVVIGNGYNTSGWTAISNENTINSDVSNRYIGVAEVNASGQVVQFTESYKLGSIYGNVTGVTDNSNITVTVKKYVDSILVETITDVTAADGYYSIRGIEADIDYYLVEFSKVDHRDPDSPHYVGDELFSNGVANVTGTIYGPDDLFSILRGRAVHSGNSSSGVANVRVKIGDNSIDPANIDSPYVVDTDTNGYYTFYNVVRDSYEYSPVIFYKYDEVWDDYGGINEGTSNPLYGDLIQPEYNAANPENGDIVWDGINQRWEITIIFIVDDSVQ